MSYVKRTIEEVIAKASDFFPVVLLTGPRQTGKTTVLRNCGIGHRTYVTLDTLDNRDLARGDPALFLQRFPPPLLIDEIQYAPELLPYIKALADERQENGLVWLTGSQQFRLMKNVSESLAGRVGILRIQGFSQAEKFGRSGVPFLPIGQWIERAAENAAALPLKEAYKMIWKGSFPRLCQASDEYWQMFYDAYVQTYIERDIKDLAAISSELSFLKFVKLAASRTGQLLNYADMAADAEISPPTAKAWLSLLQTSGVIYLLPPYAASAAKRMAKTPKLYFMDTGLACYLTGWKTPEVLEAGNMNGAMLETYVVSEILKSYWHNGAAESLFFYRDSDKREIDLLIEENGTLYPVEIKKKSNPGREDTANFKILEKFKRPTGPGAVVCLSATHLPITPAATSIPLGYL